MMKRFIAIALEISMGLSLAACGSRNRTANAASTVNTADAIESASTEDTASAESSAESTESPAVSDTKESVESIANPFVKVSGLEEAVQITGFTLTVPEAPADYPDMTVQVMDDSMIEVIFENKANETDAGIDEGYRIRKEAGSDDISGDYNEYSDVHTEEIKGMNVVVKGDSNTISVATWTNDGYSYAVDAEEHPMTLAEITTVIEAVK